jgi:hypothetical protein
MMMHGRRQTEADLLPFYLFLLSDQNVTIRIGLPSALFCFRPYLFFLLPHQLFTHVSLTFFSTSAPVFGQSSVRLNKTRYLPFAILYHTFVKKKEQNKQLY